MTDSVHNLNGLVHIFERASLDVSEALLTSEELTTVRYEKRMKPFIIGMIDYLRQDDLYVDGVDVVAWQYLLEKTQDDLLKEVDLLDDIRLVDGVLEKFIDGVWIVVGDVLQDCADVEPCIDASPSITNINNSITTINQTTQDLQDATQDLQETTDKNEYPPTPTIASEPNILCASSWYVARELDSIIQQLILGTDFQNIQEFIAYWLLDGGWRYTSLSEIWSLYNTLDNPSLAAEITSAIEFVAEIFYCNELNRDQAIIDIQASVDISTDAKALYIAVIEAWTNSKFALATAIGRDQASEDCSLFCPSDSWLRLGGDGNADMAVITGFVYGDAVYNATDDRYESPATGEVNNAYTQCNVRWTFSELKSGTLTIQVEAYRTRASSADSFFVTTDSGTIYQTKLAQATPQTFVLGVTDNAWVEVNITASSNTAGDGRYARLLKMDIT